MNVKELKQLIHNLPDETEVMGMNGFCMEPMQFASWDIGKIPSQISGWNNFSNHTEEEIQRINQGPQLFLGITYPSFTTTPLRVVVL